MHNGANDRVYHISHRGQRYGPLSRIELSSRSLTHDMLVWREGMPEWVPIAAVDELRPYVKHAANTRTTVPPTTTGRRPQAGTNPLPPIVVVPPGPPPRSGAATTIGILNVILASLTLLCWPFGILANIFPNPQLGPLADVLQRPVVRYGQATTLALGFVLAVPMLAAGIGLTRRKIWGRTLAVVCAWCGLGLQAVHFVFMLFAAILPLIEIAAELEDPSTWGAAFGALLGAVIGACGGVIYDVIVLFVMAKESVKRSLV
jgi:hypothetical protein